MSTPRILLVEDNPRDVRLTQIIFSELERFPHVLEVANDVRSGLQRVKKGDIDLVLLDLNLPETTGVETLVAWRKGAPDVAVIVLTTLADEEMAMQAARMGAQDYLVKGRMHGPLLPNVLRYAIERNRILQQLRQALAAKP